MPQLSDERAATILTRMDKILSPENIAKLQGKKVLVRVCLLYTSPSPRDRTRSRMPSSA